jgi:Flp pilus assembly protein TadD
LRRLLDFQKDFFSNPISDRIIMILKLSFSARPMQQFLLTLSIAVISVAIMCEDVRAQSPSGTVSAVAPSPETMTPMPRDPATPPPGAVVPAPSAEAPPADAPPVPAVAPVEFHTPPPLDPAIAVPSVPSVAAPAVNAAAPDATALDPLSPLPPADAGAIAGTNVMGAGAAPPAHSGTYYDADALVPDADLAAAGATGPRKVDPAYEPGQRFIVVEKSSSAESFEAQYVSATRALKLGRYPAAMEMFEKLYKKNHRDARILMGLALAQQGAGFNSSAISTYEDLLKVQPNNADAIINLMGLMKDQFPENTLKKLATLRNKYPNNPGIPAHMGQVSADMKKYDEAIRYFEIAASMDPNSAAHIYNMAIAADRKGDSKKAIKLYERALQIDASYSDTISALPREQIYDRLVVLRRRT